MVKDAVSIGRTDIDSIVTVPKCVFIYPTLEHLPLWGIRDSSRMPTKVTQYLKWSSIYRASIPWLYDFAATASSYVLAILNFYSWVNSFEIRGGGVIRLVRIEVRDVAIETTGDQGDGIAKVERGYVVIVPGGQPGDEPTVEIEQVQENVTFASIVERNSRAL